MKYIDNLIAWGDQLFRRDTLETINEATQLYLLAAEILGRRPDLIPPRGNPAIQTYNTLEASGLDEFSNAMVLAENLIPEANPLLHATGWRYNPPVLLPPVLCFCISKNEKLLGYWNLVADRLFKIRNCMNIEGVVRQLPLFEPPIEPGLLVRASALEVDLTSALSDVNVALPYYRFSVMIQKSKELCAEVKSLGVALLSALEKKDGETLSLLRSTHESELLQAVRLVKEKQIEEALRSIESLQKSQEVVNKRYVYYRDILFTTPAEMLHLEISNEQLNFQLQQIAAEITASVLHLLPDIKIGSLTTTIWSQFQL